MFSSNKGWLPLTARTSFALLSTMVLPPDCLSIHGRYNFTFNCGRGRRNPISKALLKFVRTQIAEKAIERVVRRNAIWQRQRSAQPIFFVLPYSSISSHDSAPQITPQIEIATMSISKCFLHFPLRGSCKSPKKSINRFSLFIITYISDYKLYMCICAECKCATKASIC
jgi:hypothetical protein